MIKNNLYWILLGIGIGIFLYILDKYILKINSHYSLVKSQYNQGLKLTLEYFSNQ